MKKLLIAIIIGCLSFGFAENAISLNFGWNNCFQRNVNFYNFNNALLTDDNFGLKLDYDYLFGNNFMIGSTVGIGFNLQSINDEKSLLNTVAANYSFASKLGFKLGRKNFHTFSLIPIAFDLRNIQVGTSGNKTSTAKIDYTAICTTFKSGINFNFQWGKKLCKNGFYLGAYLVWGRDIFNAKIGSIFLENQSTDKVGFEFTYGYRLSFVF